MLTSNWISNWSYLVFHNCQRWLIYFPAFPTLSSIAILNSTSSLHIEEESKPQKVERVSNFNCSLWRELVSIHLHPLFMFAHTKLIGVWTVFALFVHYLPCSVFTHRTLCVISEERERESREFFFNKIMSLQQINRAWMSLLCSLIGLMRCFVVILRSQRFLSVANLIRLAVEFESNCLCIKQRDALKVNWSVCLLGWSISKVNYIKLNTQI